MQKNSFIYIVIFILLFIPFWLSYAVLIFTTNRNRPDYEITFLSSLEFSAIIIGVSTILGALGFLRIIRKKRVIKKKNVISFLIKELFVLVLFVFTWFVVNEIILINFYYDQSAKELGYWAVLILIAENTGKIYSGVFLYISYTGLSYAFFYYQVQKIERIKAKKAQNLANQMKLKALMNYMQPHFLFNCLSSISELIHIDSQKADVALNKLSRILRYVIDHKEQLHKVSSELDLTNKYVDLQKIRFGNRLFFSKTIDIDTSSFFIPIFTIQILVENSFHHNLESFNKISSSKMIIHLEIKHSKNKILISVCDNGTKNTVSENKGSGIKMLTNSMRASYKNIYVSHGYMKKTLLNKPGYQSQIQITL